MEYRTTNVCPPLEYDKLWCAPEQGWLRIGFGEFVLEWDKLYANPYTYQLLLLSADGEEYFLEFDKPEDFVNRLDAILRWYGDEIDF